MKKILLFTLVVLLLLPCASMRFFENSGTVYAQDNWKQEYADVCGKTQNSMSLSAEELKKYLDRCDKLQARLHELNGSERKVYVKRLKMCRDLYSYTLDFINRKE